LLFRGEFLVLGHVGNGRLDPGRDAGALAEHVRRRVQAVGPQSIIYRLCDYNHEDFAFLDGAGDVVSRGAQRLLDQPALLQMDLAIVRAIRRLGVATQVLIPCIQLPRQYHAIRAAVERGLADVGGCGGIGVMLETPANLFEIEHYAGADFFVFGPGDLLKYFYGGLDRNHRHFEDANSEIILASIEHCLHHLDGVTQGKTVYLAKSLIAARGRLGLERFENIRFRNLYMPTQLIDRGRRAAAPGEMEVACRS
jgi:hypothetical protein